MNSSTNLTKIPIKNIYYMLCYAWNRLEEKDNLLVSRSDEKDIYDLLTRILVSRLQVLIRRGYYKEYAMVHEETSTIRGRINFPQSLNELTFKKARMYCQHDEMGHDILHNQIIKSTLYYLLVNSSISNELKEEVQTIYRYFTGITIIRMDKNVFHQVNIHRSNRQYGFLIDICYFLYDTLLMNKDENAEDAFVDFNQDKREMAYLFEDFVRSFYQKELRDAKVYSEELRWHATGDDLSYLPKMRTDISIVLSDRKYIMDMKFYENTLSTRYNSEKLISSNLYQIFAYINNDQSNFADKTTGVLLYPKVDLDLDLSYIILGNPIKICTVDMTQEWREIHNRLMSIVGRSV